MEGKILGVGVIRGKDGKRYAFDESDIDTQGKGIDELIGCEIDFEVQDNKAVSIYLLNSKPTSTKPINSLNPTNNSIRNLKIEFFISIILVLFGVVMKKTAVSNVCGTIVFILFFHIVLVIQKQSQSTTLFKRLCCGFVMGFIFLYVAIISMARASLSDNYLLFIWGIVLAVCFIGLIASFRFVYLFFEELAFITNKKSFLYSFDCFVAGLGIVFFGLLLYEIIGDFNTIFHFMAVCLFMFASFVSSVYTWISLEEIKKSYSAKDGANGEISIQNDIRKP